MLAFRRFLLLFVVVAVLANGNNVVRKFKEAKIDTDLNITAPKKRLEVKYGTQNVELGAILKKDQTSQQPTLKFEPLGNSLATVIMLDPDAPGREHPTKRSWLHWLVTNIRRNDIKSGKAVVEYNGPSPPPGSGPHRYVLLVFKQSASIDISPLERPSFNIANFIRNQSLTGPIYGNFYTVEVKK